VLNDTDVEVVVYADDSFVICSAATEFDAIEKANKVLKCHLEWLTSIGMVVNPTKTEVMYMNHEKTITLNYGETAISSIKSMRVLGVWFDYKLAWSTQLQKVKNACRSLRPALRLLRRKLHDEELLQVITSNYYSRLYYGSEVWYPCLSYSLKKSISPIHYFPLRLVLRDYKRTFSNATLSFLTKRATPQQYNNFKMGKALVSISTNCEPFFLFHELLTNSSIEQRKPLRPRFYDSSRSKIGRQSFPNRVTAIAQQLDFDWLQLHSKDGLRSQLKKSFFPPEILEKT